MASENSNQKYVSTEELMMSDSSEVLRKRIADLEQRLRISEKKSQSTVVELVSSHDEGQNANDQNYHYCIQQLLQIVTEDTGSFDEMLGKVLNIGLRFYQLDTAIIGTILGDSYEIVALKSNENVSYSVHSKLNLDDTVCGLVIDSDKLLAKDNLQNNEFGNTRNVKQSGVCSYIGAPVVTSNGPYGTVSFSSQTTRNRDFSKEEKSFCLLVSSWVGFLVNSQEQFEFMSSQSDYYQSLLKAVPTMVLLCDSDGLILSASDNLCKKFDMRKDEMPGKNLYSLFDDSDSSVLEEAIAVGDAQEIPIRFRMADGTTYDFELASRVKKVGVLQGVRMVVLNDVTERNAVLIEAENQNGKLEAANENLNQFAFIASHDLQEPLRKIQQFSSLLEEELQEHLTEDSEYHLGVIVDAAERMSTLIMDLLRYSGASKEEPLREHVKLNNLIEEVLTELELPIADSKAHITIESLPEVDGDRALLRQLFVNLIGNSIKYRSTDRPLQITVSGIGSDLKEGICVADNGIGFDMSFSKRIFEPFNRLHKSKEYKGNGIGLAICDTVCTKHNWNLTAESEKGVGTSFIISFNRTAA